jgi:hypothetical protein
MHPISAGCPQSRSGVSTRSCKQPRHVRDASALAQRVRPLRRAEGTPPPTVPDQHPGARRGDAGATRRSSDPRLGPARVDSDGESSRISARRCVEAAGASPGQTQISGSVSGRRGAGGQSRESGPGPSLQASIHLGKAEAAWLAVGPPAWGACRAGLASSSQRGRECRIASYFASGLQPVWPCARLARPGVPHPNRSPVPTLATSAVARHRHTGLALPAAVLAAALPLAPRGWRQIV